MAWGRARDGSGRHSSGNIRPLRRMRPDCHCERKLHGPDGLFPAQKQCPTQSSQLINICSMDELEMVILSYPDFLFLASFYFSQPSHLEKIYVSHHSRFSKASHYAFIRSKFLIVATRTWTPEGSLTLPSSQPYLQESTTRAITMKDSSLPQAFVCALLWERQKRCLKGSSSAFGTVDSFFFCPHLNATSSEAFLDKSSQSWTLLYPVPLYYTTWCFQ